MSIIKAVDKMRPQTSYDRETLHKSLFYHMLDGWAYCQMVFDAVGRPVDWIYLEVNKNFEKLTGLKDVVGKKVTELIPGVERSNPELFEIYGRVSSTGDPEKFETYVELLSRWFWVSVYSPKKNFFMAIFQNITDQKQKEKDLDNAKIAARNVLEDLQVEREKLAEAKAKDDALLESIGEGVIAVDKDGKVILINRAAEVLLGFTSREILGKLFVQTVSLQDAEGNRAPDELRPISLALSSGTTTTTTTTYYFVRRDGIKFPAAIIVTPVITNDSKAAGAIMVFRDISKEKEIEKLRADFLSLASHQLRTPLSGTKWLIETMRREILGSVTQKQKEYLDYIYKINERMIRLVSEMLNVLMWESGVTTIKKQEISVSKLCEDLLLMMESASQNKKVILHNALKNRKTFFIQSDFQVLRNILENFVSNAINYSQDGGEIFIDAKEGPDAVIFSVKDGGIGIPEDEQKRIFERFYRATNAKKFRPDGTGLGLYTAFVLAKKMGVEISFESEEGKGSTFYLRMPKMVEKIN